MLLHQKLLRQRIQNMAVSTVVIGSIFIAVSAFVGFSWISATGPEHAQMLQSMAMYTQVVAAESELVVPNKPASSAEIITVDVRKSDVFLKKLAAVKVFYRKYNAPLLANAEDFVRAADMYGIDYRLLPAISMIESTGGKVTFKSHNPFGWGRSGYPSYTAAIYDVARGMANYYKGGLKDPKRIAYRYNPVTPEAWGRKATSFMSQMPAL